MTPYATTKHAIVGLSLSLRAEAAGRGVRVSVLCPGFVDTPLLDSKGPEDLPRSRFAETVSVRAQAEQTPRGPYPPDKLARDALRGMERNRPVIIAPIGPWLVWRLYRWTPALIEFLGQKGVANIRKIGAAGASGESPSAAAATAGVESR
jgi:short-subunit dehydrogenase